MSDELKDFRYYADKAEEMVTTALHFETGQRAEELHTRIAAVYAELAKAAPKAEPEPRYIVMTPVEAEIKAATDKKFAAKLRGRPE